MSKKKFSDATGEWESYGQAGKSKDLFPSNHVHSARCYESHPPLKLVDPADGKEYFLYGGSCSTPVVKDADIYIGFDYMPKRYSEFPWNSNTDKAIHVHFPITDMHAPSDSPEAKKMVTWICNQLRAGKKIHCGCIGGHGRTGTVFAATVAEFMGELDAITYVRKNYCTKAVESSDQIKFLAKHYGVKAIAGSKDHLKGEAIWGGGKSKNRSLGSSGWSAKSSIAQFGSSVSPIRATPGLQFSGASKVIAPVVSKRCLWNEPTV